MRKEIFSVGLLVFSFSLYGQKNYQPEEDTIRRETPIEQVELFGELKKQPRKMEIITRMPLKPRDQIQSISIISEKAIADMGALSITDAAKNIPGVVLFSTYGGGAESMSIRGYRGTPTLKNGVLMNSDFRTSSMIADMQGIESVQVIRGSAAITQGFGNALGAAGGVVNLVTKTPRFYNSTNVGFRYGSWDLFRGTVDFQTVLDNNERVAIRFNAAYQNNKSYADYVKGERIYINPSVAIRPDDKTNIVLEMDYLDNSYTPNRGTVNLADDGTYAIYDLPKNKFLGFSSDNSTNRSFNYGATIERKLNDLFKLRVAYMSSDNLNESIAAGRLGTEGKNPSNYAIRKRGIAKSGGEDHSKVFQFDFVGQEVKTGIFKHTFQVGFDWKESYTRTNNYVYNGSANINNLGTINVLEDVNNILPNEVDLNAFQKNGSVGNPKTPVIGVMAQEVLSIGKYLKAIMGVRYSRANGVVEKEKREAWNPSFGLMFSPFMENVNLYGSYTTTTNLRSATNQMANGGTAGSSITRQWEAGVKSDWFDERLRFNINLYSMDMNNLTYPVVDADGNNTGFYEFAGDLTRKGIEVDLIGKILPELEVMAGYAYLDAKYENSPAFVNGSRPMMAAEHTANAWLNYTIRGGALRGLHFGGGAYYVGERPVNEFTQQYGATPHNTTPGVKPFMLKAYTTLNAQIGYNYNNIGIKIFANNLTDAIGYNAYYRGGFLNRNDPRSFAVQLNYKF